MKSRIAEKEYPIAWGLDDGLAIPHRRKELAYDAMLQ